MPAKQIAESMKLIGEATYPDDADDIVIDSSSVLYLKVTKYFITSFCANTDITYLEHTAFV